MSAVNIMSIENDLLQECKRNEMVREQSRVLLRIIYNYKENVTLLREKLEEYKVFVASRLYSDAIDMTLDFIERKKSQFVQELRDEVRSVLISIRVNTPQLNDSKASSAKMYQGQSIFEVNSNNVGDSVCWLIASYIGNYLSKKNVPKYRMFKSNDKIQIAMTHLEEFRDIDNDKEGLNEAGGFAEFFAISILLGDINYTINSAMRREENGQEFWSRIKNHNVFNYAAIKSLDDNLGLSENDININFVSEINEVINSLDEKKIRICIKNALKNLEEVYKENFLLVKEINQTIENKLVINDIITVQGVEDSIMEHIRDVSNLLRVFTEKNFNRLMNNLLATNKTLGFEGIIQKLYKDQTIPSNLDLFMKYAIKYEDFSAVDYINELNNKLHFKRIYIDGSTPLEFALNEEKNEIALRMMKSGYLLNYDKANKNEKDQKNVLLALENLLSRKISVN